MGVRLVHYSLDPHEFLPQATMLAHLLRRISIQAVNDYFLIEILNF